MPDPLRALRRATGTWTGEKAIHNPDGSTVATSMMQLAVRPILNGAFVLMTYEWDHGGKAQEGLFLIGSVDAGLVTGHWADTWHMGKAVMACLGAATEAALSMTGSYRAPPGPDWGWRISLSRQQSFEIVMHNITPDGVDQLAVTARLRHVADLSRVE